MMYYGCMGNFFSLVGMGGGMENTSLSTARNKGIFTPIVFFDDKSIKFDFKKAQKNKISEVTLNLHYLVHSFMTFCFFASLS